MSTLHVVVAVLSTQATAFYTPDEAAILLRVPTSTVRGWIRSKKLFAYRVSDRTTRIPLTSVMEMLGESQPVTHRTLSPAQEDAVWAEIEADKTAGSDR
jgi:excisionase family DNA binding protein